ncbi:MAG: hemolysin family protein [Chloroflexi bacterium]|nr:hemolysin family protein [Chloroflexota bacterium]MCY4246442.1 hemolysin family protein [Chloroflexota bacterium]
MDANVGAMLLALALLLHAVVSLLHAALQSASHATMRELADDGDARALGFLAIYENPLRLSMSVTLIHILTRIAIAVLLTLLLSERLASGEPALNLLWAGLVVVLGAGITLLLGDLLPEALGSAYGEALLPLAVAPMRLLLTLVAPLTAAVLLLARLISRAVGSQPLVNMVTEEEIMTIVNASHSGGVIEAEEKDMIASVLQLGETSARELMTPRIDIVALDVNESIRTALAVFVESGFSRIPVYADSIDNVLGLLNAKDILTLLKNRDDLGSQQIRDWIRPTCFVPETKPADALLKEMQTENAHLAIVVDEYGGTSGLVTIENLIEEIIGDIRDEYDFGEEEEYVAVDDGSYLIEGGMDLDDLNTLLDVGIDTAAADTLGGYIYLALGRVPQTGETIETGILSMTVLSIDGHRIRKVRVRKVWPTAETSAAPNAAK